MKLIELENRCINCPAFYEYRLEGDYDAGCVLRNNINGDCLYDKEEVSEELWDKIKADVDNQMEEEQIDMKYNKEIMMDIEKKIEQLKRQITKEV